MEWEILASLGEADRRAVLAATSRRRFARGEVLFREGEPADTLHLIESGTVAARVETRSGDRVTVQVLGRGEVVGEMALVAEADTRSATVYAFEPTETLALARRDLDALRSRHPGVDRALIEILVRKLTRQSLLAGEARSVPADQRVLRRLVDLAPLFAVDGAELVIPVSQDDLAGLAVTTRETVNRTLRSAAQDGLVTLGRAKVAIVDLAALSRRAE